MDEIVVDDPCGFKEFIVSASFRDPMNKPILLYGSSDAQRCIEAHKKVWKEIRGCESEECGQNQPSVEQRMFTASQTFIEVRDALDLDERPFIHELFAAGQKLLNTDAFSDAISYLDIEQSSHAPVYAYLDCFKTFYLYVMLTDV